MLKKKVRKLKHKCKITFYLNESDLEDGKGRYGSDQKGHMLSKIMENLSGALDKKLWRK